MMAIRRLFRAVTGALVLLALLNIAGCDRSRQEARNAAPAAKQSNESAIHYVKVTEETIPEVLDLSAKVQPNPTKVVRIFPPASGRVVAIEVKPGDHVHRGQTLAIMASSDVATARSDFHKARTETERTVQVANRQKLLFEHGAGAEKDYVDARAQADSAQSEFARAKQRLEMLNVSPSATSDRVILSAPTDGVVLDVSAAPGELSKSLESANPIISIADLNTVWVLGDAFEQDIAKLKQGKSVTVTLQAYPQQHWDGRIDAISDALDPTTRSLKVRVVLSNRDHHLKPEMFGAIHINAGFHRGLLVPSTAIIREGNTATVFVRNAGKSEQRSVTIGTPIDGKTEVTNGLHAGDEVAAEGAELLTGGPGE